MSLEEDEAESELERPRPSREGTSREGEFMEEEELEEEDMVMQMDLGEETKG